ncbi:MAG: gliding motility-associated C-terminal domain-containing protein [Cyclobacteriaceae bacterium]
MDVVTGCAPLSVTATNVVNESPLPPFNWNPDWDGDETTINVDPNAPQVATFTYDTPGSYLLLQVLGNRGQDESSIDTIRIEVLPPTRPTFRVYNCINNSIFIDFSNDTIYDELLINYGDGNSETVAVSAGSISHAYADEDEYSIMVEGVFADGDASNCGTYDTLITTIQDLDIAELDLIRVDSEQEIEIAYTLNDPLVSYRLEVSENGQDDFSFAAFDLNSSSSAYVWNDSRINTEENYYCFRLVALNRCDESLNQYSDTACSIALTAEAENEQNVLDWQSTGYTEYFVNREGSRISTVNNTTFTDTDVICQEEYLYSVTAQANGVTSLSNQISLTAISTNQPPPPSAIDASLRGRNAEVSWSGAPDAAKYYIYRSRDGADPVRYDSLLSSATVTYNYVDQDQLQVEVEYCYQFSYLDDCGNESALSATACVNLPPQARIFFPNAFTPNGDGINDVFVYKASLLQSVNFKIYNRWGELLFFTEEIGEGWNGRYQNSAAPQGVYIYELQVTDEMGNFLTRRGNFSLIGSVAD